MSRRQESSADCDVTDLMGESNFLCRVSLPREQSTDNYPITQFMLSRCLPSDSCINFSIASLNCRVKSQYSFEEISRDVPFCLVFPTSPAQSSQKSIPIFNSLLLVVCSTPV
ncbi:hypothetical protein VNO77_23463 [Canavalia gladiata]|uniref:Uncharacterized protein n=1 Tax=Canavalia gladiata TaxID=3824 RepID=A0AAN9L7U7_CANGL